MVEKNIKKTLVIFLAAFIAISSIINTIIASDIVHTLTCHEHDCEKCELIHFFQNNYGVLHLYIPPAIIAIIIFSIVISKNVFELYIKNDTPIDLKIQLNN